MACVLVTSGGWGDLWLFQTRNDAYMSPLHQYGDALLSRPEDVCSSYNWLEWDRLRSVAKLPVMRVVIDSVRGQRQTMEAEAPQILEALMRLAHPAPTDPAEVCRRIVEDRRRLGTVAKKKHDAPPMPHEAAPAPAAKEGKSNLPAAVKGPKGVALDAVITFGVDKEGNAYGPEVNNPKKEGSKTRTRFACYREGMTIQQALDAGITTADLNYDRDHGFVKFGSGGTSEEASEGEMVEGDTNEDAIEGTEWGAEEAAE